MSNHYHKPGIAAALVAALFALSALIPAQAANPLANGALATIETESGVIDSVNLPNIGISDRVYVISQSTQIRYFGRNATAASLSKGMRVEFKVAPFTGIDGPQPVLEINVR